MLRLAAAALTSVVFLTGAAVPAVAASPTPATQGELMPTKPPKWICDLFPFPICNADR